MGAQMQRGAYSRVCGAATAKRPAALGYAGAGPAQGATGAPSHVRAAGRQDPKAAGDRTRVNAYGHQRQSHVLRTFLLVRTGCGGSSLAALGMNVRRYSTHTLGIFSDWYVHWALPSGLSDA